MIKVLASFLFFTCASICFAQDFHIKQYRVDDGLPSDIIKGCAQDSLGYFWIATDDGLVKYDGIKFTTYREPLHNGYTKGFFRLSSGRLFVFGDLDLIEIRNLGDTVIFRPILEVARSPDNQILSYPKGIYEDHQGDIWISEPQSVVRLHGKQFKRFNFDFANRSPQFLRSFSFVEDRQNNLLVTSYQGNVFQWNRAKDEFDPVPVNMPFGIEHIAIADNRLLIGCSTGLYESTLPETGGFSKPELKFNKSLVSFIARLADQKYFIATRGTQHYIADLKANTYKPIPFQVNNINHVYVSSDNDLWLSGNDGLILLKERLFHQASEGTREFIEDISDDFILKKILYATQSAVYSFDLKQKRNEEIISIHGGYFQSVVFSKEGIWASNAFTVFLLKENKIKKKFDFSKSRFFVHDLIQDSKDNLWIAQPGNSVAFMVDSNLKLQQFHIPLGKEGVVNQVREGQDGMYIGSSGKNSYLFFKGVRDSVFRNISVPIEFPTQGDFNITGIGFMNNQIWLTSSEGLLKFDSKSIEQVNLGTTFTGLPTKSIEVYQKNKLLFSNVYGLILYDPAKDTYALFNESSGLLSNTITPRGLFVDVDDGVWIGTSKGLCYSHEPLTASQKTPTPRIVDFRANDKKLMRHHQKEIAYGSFITASISSITFPETEVIIQYRLVPQHEWQTVAGSTINFSDLASGKYNIEIRARKNGPYTWSDSAFLTFKISNPFWLETWFYLCCVVCAGILVFISIVWTNYTNGTRRKKLELLIDERTNALRLSNEELSIRNNELDRFVYSASHDLSAPLKSILGLITVAQMEKPSPEINQYLDLMKRSVVKLDSFIRDIISYSRNARLPVDHLAIDCSALIESVWADHQFSPNVDKIKFEVVNRISSPFRSDETRLKIIFNNLISNAIKFYRADSSPFIRISATEFLDVVEFKVEDNGQGIPPALQDKIFEMFFRATETVQGSGLGLYILKETLSRLNGTVKVESVLGEGTTFIITLPK